MIKEIADEIRKIVDEYWVNVYLIDGRYVLGVPCLSKSFCEFSTVEDHLIYSLRVKLKKG